MSRRCLLPLLLVVPAIGVAGAARADSRCSSVPMGDRLNMGLADCPVQVERASARTNPELWRRGDANPRTIPMMLPGPGGNGATFMRAPLGPTREGPLELGDVGLVPDGKGGYRGTRPGYRVEIERDGTIHFVDKPAVALGAVGIFFLAGVFDLTDMVMRAAGMDPYAHDKGRVAELTRAMRLEMGDVERPRRMAMALAGLPTDLERLWQRSDLSADRRRELLFQMWDDLAEGEGPEGSAAVQARAEILRFIARTLPSGSRDAFTAGELARLNARRRSQGTFAPYGAAAAD